MGNVAPGEKSKEISPLQQKVNTLASLEVERERWLTTRARMVRAGAKHAWNPKLGEVEYLAPDQNVNRDWKRTDGRMNHLLGALSALNAGYGLEGEPQQPIESIPIQRIEQPGVEVPVDYSQFEQHEIDGA